ncbi:MAG: WecB/TagA/CpsF family glycosyltransferase, partial [Verrucomicrobiota bacterium]
EHQFPGIKVVGTYTPPFRPLNEEEEQDLKTMVADLKPDFFWVGLSTPKQENFMARYLDKLDAKIMLGVGAAFDINTGHIKDAPDWMKNSGLQWFHRLLQEPRRLARRYLINNPIFVMKIMNQMIGFKKYEL